MGNERYQYFDYADKKIIVDLNNRTCAGIDKRHFSKTLLQESDNALKKALNIKTNIEEGINTVYFLITKKCNLNCSFCSIRADVKKNSQVSEINIQITVDKVIPYLKQINPRKLIITGGEPLLNTELVDIVKKIRVHLPNTYISLQSNGFLIDGFDKIHQLAKGINHVEISSSHYKKFYQLKKIVNILKTHGVDIVLSYTTEGDITGIKNILDFVVKMNIGFMLNFIAPLGSAVDNNLHILDYEERVSIFQQIAEYVLEKRYLGYGFLDLFRQKIEVRNSCNALGKMLAIYPDGKCYICHSLCEERFTIGDLKKDSIEVFKEKWNEIISENEIVNMIDVDHRKPCKICKVRYLCGGICAAHMDNCRVQNELCKLQRFLLAFNLLVDNIGASEEENLCGFISLCGNKNQILNI